MPKNYPQLFVHLAPPEPPEGLLAKIMLRIHEEQRLLTLRQRLTIFSVGLLGSLAALLPAFRVAQTGLTESGFTTFFSLLFSDSGTVVTYWQNFILALLESLPVMSIVLFVTTIFIFLKSLQLLTRDIKLIFTPVNNA